MRYFIACVVCGLVLSACESPVAGLVPTPTPTCLQQAVTFVVELESIAREWDDADKLAGQTPRASLSAQIGVLQSIRRKAQDISAPDCVKTAQDRLIDAMDSTIEGYLAFLAQESDTLVQMHFSNADIYFKAYSSELMKLRAPSVTGTPTTRIGQIVL